MVYFHSVKLDNAQSEIYHGILNDLGISYTTRDGSTFVKFDSLIEEQTVWALFLEKMNGWLTIS